MPSDWFLVGLIASAAGTAAGAIGTAAGSALTGAGTAATAAGLPSVGSALTGAGGAVSGAGPALTGALDAAIPGSGITGGAGLFGSQAGSVAGGAPTTGGITGSAGPSSGGVAPTAPAAPAASPPPQSGAKAILGKLFGKDPGATAAPPGAVYQANAPMGPGGTGAGTGSGMGPWQPTTPSPSLSELTNPAIGGPPPATTPYATPAAPAAGGSTLPIFQGKAGSVLQNLIKARTTIADPLAPGSPLSQFTRNISPQNRALLAYALKRKRNPDDHISALGNLSARF